MLNKYQKQLFCLALIACLIFLYYNVNYGQLRDWLTLHRLESRLSISIPSSAQQVLYVNSYSDWTRDGAIYFVYSLTDQEIKHIQREKKFHRSWSNAPLRDEIYLDMQSDVANDMMFEIYNQPIPFDLQSGYYIIVDREKRVLNKLSPEDYHKYHDFSKQACLGMIDLTSDTVYLLMRYY